MRHRATLVLAIALLSLGRLSAQSPSDRWVDNTSGPFYTGTADVEPGGSYYIEPYVTNYRSKDTRNLYLPMKFAYGAAHKTEFDLFVPFTNNSSHELQGSASNGSSTFGYADTQVQVKRQLVKEADRYRLWRMPSLGLSFALNLPTGKYANLDPNLHGADQRGNGTWNEQINFLLRKEFKPFELYLEASEVVENPVRIVGPYQFNNGINSLPAGSPLHMVDGNLLSSAGTLEHVLAPRHGFGYMVEYTYQHQSARSLFFGPATAPSFYNFNLIPELEVTWPNGKSFPVTWAVGNAFTVARNNFPHQLTPMFTITFYGNIHGGR
jgi:hypothetical protein